MSTFSPVINNNVRFSVVAALPNKIRNKEENKDNPSLDPATFTYGGVVYAHVKTIRKTYLGTTDKALHRDTRNTLFTYPLAEPMKNTSASKVKNRLVVHIDNLRLHLMPKVNDEYFVLHSEARRKSSHSSTSSGITSAAATYDGILMWDKFDYVGVPLDAWKRAFHDERTVTYEAAEQLFRGQLQTVQQYASTASIGSMYFLIKISQLVFLIGKEVSRRGAGKAVNVHVSSNDIVYPTDPFDPVEVVDIHEFNSDRDVAADSIPRQLPLRGVPLEKEDRDEWFRDYLANNNFSREPDFMRQARDG
jgi:hypothetical protein